MCVWGGGRVGVLSSKTEEKDPIQMKLSEGIEGFRVLI